jgi:hypothetical protein
MEYLNTVPVIRESGDEDSGYLFSFGAYGSTLVAVLGGSLEDGLEACFEWLDDHAPGILSHVDYEGTAKELGVPWPTEVERTLNLVLEKAEMDMTLCSHTVLTHGNCIPSWEWSARELSDPELRLILARPET